MEMGTSLMLSMLFGAVGVGYFMYGKKRQNAITMLSGVALCVFPYFVSNAVASLLIGLVLTVLPWVLGIS
jgi:hypothetical protein